MLYVLERGRLPMTQPTTKKQFATHSQEPTMSDIDHLSVANRMETRLDRLLPVSASYLTRRLASAIAAAVAPEIERQDAELQALRELVYAHTGEMPK